MSETQERRTTAVKAAWWVALALVTSGSVLLGYLALAGPGSPAKRHAIAGGSSSSTVLGPQGQVNGCSSNGNCNGRNKEFGVAVGDVAGLFPGATTPLPVTYTNPNSFGIKVTSATVTATLITAGAAAAPGCSNSYVVTGTYPNPAGVVVARNGTASATLPFGLKATAPDACKRARWKITVTATAVK